MPHLMGTSLRGGPDIQALRAPQRPCTLLDGGGSVHDGDCAAPKGTPGGDYMEYSPTAATSDEYTTVPLDIFSTVQSDFAAGVSAGTLEERIRSKFSTLPPTVPMPVSPAFRQASPLGRCVSPRANSSHSVPSEGTHPAEFRGRLKYVLATWHGNAVKEVTEKVEALHAEHVDQLRAENEELRKMLAQAHLVEEDVQKTLSGSAPPPAGMPPGDTPQSNAARGVELGARKAPQESKSEAKKEEPSRQLTPESEVTFRTPEVQESAHDDVCLDLRVNAADARQAGAQDAVPAMMDSSPQSEGFMRMLSNRMNWSTKVMPDFKGQQVRQTWSRQSSASASDVIPDGGLVKIAKSGYFEGFYSFVILVNCVFMGIEAESLLGEPSDGLLEVLSGMEHTFTSLFTAEVVINVKAFGFVHYHPIQHTANLLDAILVLSTGILFTWIVPMISMAAGFNGLDPGIVRVLTVLRALRLLRLVRVMQKIRVLREAWLLLRGLVDSVRTLFWTCVVIMFITYMFAVFGVVLISKDLYNQMEETSNPDTRAELEDLMQYLGGLDLLMHTLLQVLTMDSFHGIMRPLEVYVNWSYLYFYAYICIAVFVLMNLVTAIIVENAVSMSKNDEEDALLQKEKDARRELSELQHLFLMMDTDGDGSLCWEEFEAAFADPEMSKKWKLLDFSAADCKEIFDLLDDGDGNIDTQEFFDGLRKMKGTAQSRDIFRINKGVEKLREQTRDFITQMGFSPTSAKSKKAFQDQETG